MQLDDYIPIVGRSVIEDLRLLSERLSGRRIQHINSTAVGGGVAEILNRMVPLCNELGVDSRWDVITGGERFFGVTKKFHNALHGKPESLTREDFEVFVENGRLNAERTATDADIVFIHDPQPVTLIEKKSGNKWIWRCHVDVSDPLQEVWRFLADYVVRYDAAVFSAPGFSRELPMRQALISPSIDPLSDKNRDIGPDIVDAVMNKYGIPRDKPIVTQISRFDRLKDPVGVLEAYRIAKKNVDCRLVLAGGTASDDPEGAEVYQEVLEKAAGDPDVHILLMSQNDIEINALQRASDVIVQKSLKEGFGLTVTEALWKAKPVLASAVGGIPLQIRHKYSGMLCHSVDGAAFSLKQLLNSPEFAKKLGENGREHVRNNFLLTRHLRDYLLLFLSMNITGDVVYL
ncbi:glycosyltransferase [bacterium]|nr:glycosyltransferase [bacterium]